MDSITHIALGACMGEAFGGRTLGKKAMIWGALAQSAPDIDFLSTFWMDTPASLLAHRGFTHSLLFCFVIAFVLALIAERWHRAHLISFGKWISFFSVVIFIHIFIDAFNNYGVGWFEPFSHKRIAFNVIYVADPFFSIGPGVAFAALLVLKKNSGNRRFWGHIGISLAVVYLLYCILNKTRIDHDTRNILEGQGISYNRYFTSPAPFQNWLWYLVAEDNTGYHVGYRSVFDSRKQIDFHYFARNDSLIQSVSDRESLSLLVRFSKGFYTIEKRQDTLVFNDLRFGQIAGWYHPDEKFVLHYYLSHPGANRMVVQRGRLSNWDREVIQSFFARIRGN